MSQTESREKTPRLRKWYCDIVSNDPFDFVEVALALEILAYHNKNYLSKPMCDDCVRSEEMQLLLQEALKRKR